MDLAMESREIDVSPPLTPLPTNNNKKVEGKQNVWLGS